MLQNYGFDKILEAVNGQEAVLLAVAHKPVLIVMDVTMPVMNGITAATILRDQMQKLEETLETRRLVDKAKGVLMDTGLNEPDAYRKMQKLAMGKPKRSLYLGHLGGSILC